MTALRLIMMYVRVIGESRTGVCGGTDALLQFYTASRVHGWLPCDEQCPRASGDMSNAEPTGSASKQHPSET